MRNLFILIPTAIILALVAFFIIEKAPRVNLFGNSVSATNTQQNIVVRTESEHEEGDAYTIDVKYPQFGIPAIDAKIKSAIDDAVKEIKDMPANPPDSATPQNSLDGSYDSVYVGPDIISVVLQLSQYTGGAHPMTILSGMNFDRKSGKQLLLDDVLAADRPYTRSTLSTSDGALSTETRR
jgi:hypothetical protein